MLRSLPDALKYARRCIHLYPDAWNVLIASKGPIQQMRVWSECVRTLAAGSIPLQNANHSTMSLYTAKGGTFRFRVIDNMNDAHRLKGHIYTQVMWMHDPWDSDIKKYIATLVRPAVVPESALCIDDVAL